jgi:muconolactone delta-isomerase
MTDDIKDRAEVQKRRAGFGRDVRIQGRWSTMRNGHIGMLVLRQNSDADLLQTFLGAMPMVKEKTIAA